MMWLLCALMVPAVMLVTIMVVSRATMVVPATEDAAYKAVFSWAQEVESIHLARTYFCEEVVLAFGTFEVPSTETQVHIRSYDPPMWDQWEMLPIREPMRPRCNRLSKSEAHRVRDGHPVGRRLHLTESEKWELVRAEAVRVELDDEVWWNITRPLLKAELGLR